MNIAKFIREVRSEFKKVIWPTKREGLYSFLVTIVLIAIMSLFFFLIDQIISLVLHVVL